MSPIDRNLLPLTAEVGATGGFLIGGCPLEELAVTYGTPLFVYDEEHLRARCREAVAAFGDGVAYAAKAFLCMAMARLVHEEGMCIDVASGGELHVALSAGVPASSLIFHGNNKSTEELEDALAAGVGRIVVDSVDELDRLECLHTRDRARPRILLRLTPGIAAPTHEFLRTGQTDSKFGFALATSAAAAVDRARRSPAVDLVGLHAHIGSEVFATHFFADAIDAMAPFVLEHDLPELSIGGGIGVAYVHGDRPPSITEWAEAVHRACAEHGLRARVTAEPGRSISAQAAVTLYTVGTIKEVPGARTYVSVDGGMSDNLRPVLYGSRYEAFLPRRATTAHRRPVTIVGKHCESGDVLIRDTLVPDDLRVGDLLATPVTGAYGHSMASNYNKILRPPVVFVRDGRARLVVRRETEADLIACDV